MAKTAAKPQEPTTITSTHLQQNYGDIIRRATLDREHFIVTRDGFPTIAILSAAEYHELMQAKQGKK